MLAALGLLAGPGLSRWSPGSPVDVQLSVVGQVVVDDQRNLGNV